MEEKGKKEQKEVVVEAAGGVEGGKSTEYIAYVAHFLLLQIID